MVANHNKTNENVKMYLKLLIECFTKAQFTHSPE